MAMSTELPLTEERFDPDFSGYVFPERLQWYGLVGRVVAGKDVLDIAFGEGLGSRLLAVEAGNVVSIDISEPAVALAQKRYGGPRLRFETGSATAIPLPDASLDVVVSFGTTEHRSNHQEMLAEVKRVLRPGGVLVMSTPDKSRALDASGHVDPSQVPPSLREQFDAFLSSQFSHVRIHGPKAGVGSMITSEDGNGLFAESHSQMQQTVSSPAKPLYLIGVASDDPAAAVALNGLFSQHRQAFEPVSEKFEFALKQAQARFDHELSLRDQRDAAFFEDIKWLSAEIASLQRSNWMSRASLFKIFRRMAKVRLLYALSHWKLLSERRRARFFRSAEKRDPMLLSARLDRFCKQYFSRIEQSNFFAAEQRDVLLRQGLRVTAVVPNYNHARYLHERLDSILAQTYPLIDIIVLDDCSTDDSRHVIEEYTARYPDRIKAVYNDANSGSVFRQWQKGHELATGDIVWFCESDDFCAPTFVERLIGHFRDSSVMLAFGKIEFADEVGTLIPGMDHYLESAEQGIWDKPCLRPAAVWFQAAFGIKNVIANVGGSLWRRAPLSDAVWDEARSYRIMGDWYLYSVVANGGQIAFDPAALAYFRIHSQNTSRGGAQGKPEYYQEYTRLMTALKRRWPIPDRTIDQFIDSCHKIYRGGGLKSPDFETLVPASALKAVRTDIPHVLIGILGFSYGGAEIFPIHLANALHKRGVMVSMLTMMDTEDHPDVRAMLHSAIPVYTANFARDMGVRHFVSSIGVTIVHSHIASIEKLLLDEGKVDLPYMSTLHGSYEAMEIPKRSVASWAGKIDRFGYLTERNLEAFSGIMVPQEKFCKLRNAMPIDPRPYRRTRAEMHIPEAAVVFTLVARGAAGKGWHEAVKAFLALKARRPAVSMALLAAGDGPLTTSARELAGTDPDIHFLGFEDTVHGIYRLTDVALVPTRYPGESYPLCLIQAMQVGVPAIATDTGEIANMIHRDGQQAGLTIPYLDDDEAFVAAVVDAMDQMLDQELRTRLAKGASVLGEGYAIDRVAGTYLAMYQDILERRSPVT